MNTPQIPSPIFYHFAIDSKYASESNPSLFTIYPPSDYKDKEYLYYCNIIENKRVFGITTIRRMFEFLLSIPPPKRNVFELCPSEWYRKLYFDIDISRETPEYDKSDSIIQVLIHAIQDSINECFEDGNEDEEDVYPHNIICKVTQSHTSFKKSYHIITPDFACKNYIGVKAFYNMVMQKLPSELVINSTGKANNIIDPKVYSSNQNFRLLYCTKPGRQAYKLLDNSPILDELTLTKIKHMSDTRLEKVPQYKEFKDMLITYVPGRTMILDIPHKYNKIPKSNNTHQVASHSSLLNAYNIWRSNNKELADQYKIPSDTSYDIKNNRIRLDRIKPGLCEKCDRVHYKDNAYLVVNNNGNVYFNCYRNEPSHTRFNGDPSITFGKIIGNIRGKILDPDKFKDLPNRLRPVLAILHEGEGGSVGEAVVKMKNEIARKPLQKFTGECNMYIFSEIYYTNSDPPEKCIRKHKFGNYLKTISSQIFYDIAIFKPYSPGHPTKFEEPGVLNVFPGFKAVPIPDNEYDYDRYVKAWLDHMRIILCDDNIEVFNNVIGFRAHLIQYPYEKPSVTHLFQSEKGAGKNTELDFFTMEVVGPELGVIVDNIDAIIGPFNALAKNQIFIVLDETKSNKGDKDKFKSFATQMYHIINPKGKDMYKTINYSRITNITNEEGPLPLVEEGSRRFLVQRCNNKYSAERRRKSKTLDIEARDYFNNLHRNIFTPLGARHIMKYLLDYDLVASAFDPFGLPPTTKYLKELETYSELIPITFLKEWDWTRTLPDGGKDHMVIPCRIRDIVDEFIKWIKERSILVSNNYKTSRGFEKAVIKDKYRSLIQKIDRKLNNAWLYTNQNIQNKRRAIIDL